jgi:hypothetical protein
MGKTRKREIQSSNTDAFVKSPKSPFSVIPAKAGIQVLRALTECLDPGFHRGDDFLRGHQYSITPILHHSNLRSAERVTSCV